MVGVFLGMMWGAIFALKDWPLWLCILTWIPIAVLLYVCGRR